MANLSHYQYQNIQNQQYSATLKTSQGLFWVDFALSAHYHERGNAAHNRQSAQTKTAPEGVAID